MILLRFGGATFQCETAAEAAQLFRALQSTPPPASQASLPLPEPKRQAGHYYEPDFIARLRPYAGQEVKSDTMMVVVQAKSSNGVGPRLRSIRKEMEAAGLHLEDYLTALRKPDGTTNWLVNSELQQAQ